MVWNLGGNAENQGGDEQNQRGNLGIAVENEIGMLRKWQIQRVEERKKQEKMITFVKI